MSELTPSNDQQIAHWNDNAGRTWAELAPLLDRLLGGPGRTTIQALAPRTGERILDVGCGAGRTAIDLGAIVGPTGSVVGVDISRPMLSVAEGRARDAGATHVRFLEADAQTHPFAAGSFDAVFSAMGVMFFADPIEAFKRLRSALRAGGRLAFLCWRSPGENPVMTLPMAAARDRFPPLPPPVAGAPGPFAFADPAHVRNILEQAGFASVDVTAHDTELGGNTLEETLTLALRVGSLASALREHPALAEVAREDARAALAPFVRDGAVWQRAALWIVTARNPS